MAKKNAKPATTKATKVKADIVGLVLLRGIIADSENPDRIGLSFQHQDEQSITMEVAVNAAFAKNLAVDKTYRAEFFKGSKPGGAGFNIHFLNEVDLGNRYEEKMITKGEFEGHVFMRVLPKQENVFFEKKDYTVTLTEVKQKD